MLLQQSFGTIYTVDTGQHSIQIPRTTSVLELDLQEFPLAFNMSASAKAYTIHNTSTINDSIANSLCKLTAPMLDLNAVWNYNNLTNQGLNIIAALNGIVVALNSTTLKMTVFALNPPQIGTASIVGNISTNFTTVAPFPTNNVFIDIDLNNSRLFIATNNTILVYQFNVSANQQNVQFAPLSDANSVQGYVPHQNLNMMKFYNGHIFVCSDMGMEIYQLNSNTNWTVLYSLTQWPNIQDVAFNGDYMFMLDPNQSIHIQQYSLLNATTPANNSISCAAGGRFIGYQDGWITILGVVGGWYMEDFYNSSTTLTGSNVSFSLNRLRPLPFNISTVAWDSQFLYMINGPQTFMMQTGIPSQYASDVTQFAYSFSNFGVVVDIFPIRTPGWDSQMIILSPTAISLLLLEIDDPYMMCTATAQTSDGIYVLSIQAMLKNCPQKELANDTWPLSICQITQRYQIELSTTDSPEVSSNHDLAIGLGVGLTLALLLGIGCCVVVRRYKKKNEELENRLKFQKLSGDAEGIVNELQESNKASYKNQGRKLNTSDGNLNNNNSVPLNSEESGKKIKKQGKSPQHKGIEIEITDKPDSNMDDIYSLEKKNTDPFDEDNKDPGSGFA
jgi:hypothetical protein